MSETFSSLFQKYTERVPGDGNCFIYSAMRIYPKTISSAKRFREILYQMLVSRFGQDYVSNNPDYKNLRNNKSWVEWSAGSAALSLLTNEPVVVVSEFGSIRALNGNVEILDSAERNEAILANEATIVYNNSHYQPLSLNRNERLHFVSELTKIDKSKDIEHSSEKIAEKVNSASEQVILDSKPNREQILYDAIDNAFSGNNKIQARNFVDEILKNVPEDEKENMLTILLGGIVAQYEYDEHKEINSQKSSILKKAKVAEMKSVQFNEKVKSENAIHESQDIFI